MPKFVNTLSLTLGTLVLVSQLGGCATKETKDLEPTVDETVVVVQGVPGGMRTRTLTLTAKVESIDHKSRSVTLVDDKGGRQTLAVGPEVVNFDQVAVGDQLNIAYLEELVVFLKAINAPSEDSAALIASSAEEGEKPGALVAGMVEVTAKVTAIDLENHTATLTFTDGSSRVVPVRKDVELREDQVGREVVIQKSTAIAIAVEEVQ